jgi:hypothetical protein
MAELPWSEPWNEKASGATGHDSCRRGGMGKSEGRAVAGVAAAALLEALGSWAISSGVSTLDAATNATPICHRPNMPRCYARRRRRARNKRGCLVEPYLQRTWTTLGGMSRSSGKRAM